MGDYVKKQSREYVKNAGGFSGQVGALVTARGRAGREMLEWSSIDTEIFRPSCFPHFLFQNLLVKPVAMVRFGSASVPVNRCGSGGRLRFGTVRIVVAYGRILIFCNGQHGEHVLPKTTTKKPNQALGILMKLAVDREWSNPSSGASDHESVRKNFQRLESLLRALVPFPGKPFRKEAGKFIPCFKIGLHPEPHEVRVPFQKALAKGPAIRAGRGSKSQRCR